MNKLINIKRYVQKNKKVFMFLIVLVLIGITAGSIFSVTLKPNDNGLVKNYLENYLSSINNKEIVILDSFFSSITSNFFIIISIFLLGLSFIGIPIILIIFFYKSFIFGFTLGSILINYKIKGILLSIIYMFPHNLIDLFTLILFTIMSFNISKNVLNAVIRKDTLDYRFISKYIKRTILVFLIYTFISLYSSVVVPSILRYIQIFKLL